MEQPTVVLTQVLLGRISILFYQRSQISRTNPVKMIFMASPASYNNDCFKVMFSFDCYQLQMVYPTIEYYSAKNL